MRIILLGAPGSGKSTQAQFIEKKCNIPKISTGDILRTRTTLDSKNNEIINLINFGKLIDDELIISIVTKRIMNDDCKNGFLLDGFPRTIRQAYATKNKNFSIDIVLEFSMSDSLIIDRIVGRQIHVPSGRIYHSKFNPPKKQGIDNITGDPLITRKDDDKNIVYQRLFEFHRQINPLIEYYRKESDIGNIKYFNIDANQTVYEINKNLLNILKN